MKDEQYKRIINEKILSDEDDFFSDKRKNDSEILKKLFYKSEKKTVIPIWFYRVASVIFIFFMLSFLYQNKINKKNDTIAELNQKIEQLSKIDTKFITKYITDKDTVFVDKPKYIYSERVVTNTVIKEKNSVDTIFVTKIEEPKIQKEIKESIVKNDFEIPMNNKNIKKKNKKESGFKIIFGNKNSDYKYKNNSLSAFSFTTSLNN